MAQSDMTVAAKAESATRRAVVHALRESDQAIRVPLSIRYVLALCAVNVALLAVAILGWLEV